MNETDTFADDEGQNDEYFDFEDISGKFKNDCSSPCNRPEPVLMMILFCRHLSTKDWKRLYINRLGLADIWNFVCSKKPEQLMCKTFPRIELEIAS